MDHGSFGEKNASLFLPIHDSMIMMCRKKFDQQTRARPNTFKQTLGGFEQNQHWSESNTVDFWHGFLNQQWAWFGNTQNDSKMIQPHEDWIPPKKFNIDTKNDHIFQAGATTGFQGRLPLILGP